MKKAIIIGAGFGGLALAIRLQSRGFAVTLLEKNSRVGGHASQIISDGYTFDMGPSLITAPDIIRDVFAAANRNMEDYLSLSPLDPFYRIYFHDKTYLDYSADASAMKEQLRQFHSGDADNYDRFMDDCREIYDAVITDKLGAQPFMDWQSMLTFLPRALRLKALFPVHSFIKRYFSDPRTRFAFSFHPLFIGGNPFRAPSVYLMIPYLEKTGGVWFTKGGMYSLVQAFEKLFTELGGTILTDTPADEIILKNGQAVGVRTKDIIHSADIVISNADFAHTYSDLVPESSRGKWTDGKVRNVNYSMSAYLLYLGVRHQYPELKHHTLILSERYRSLVKDIFDRKILANDFSMYLHVPTRTDPDMAPPGSESMYVLIPVPNLQSGIDWQTQQGPFTNRVLDFLEYDFGLTNLRENIEFQQVFTPQDFQTERNSYMGSAWGVEPRLTQTAIFRPHNKSEDIENLYLVGASTHPGAGVPGVLLTAEATENAIRQDLADQSFQLRRA